MAAMKRELCMNKFLSIVRRVGRYNRRTPGGKMKVLDNLMRAALVFTFLMTMVGDTVGQTPATPASWALKTERTANGPEADLVVRTGDINNLGFGWPDRFDPFSGKSTPGHGYPWDSRPGAPDG